MAVDLGWSVLRKSGFHLADKIDVLTDQQRSWLDLNATLSELMRTDFNRDRRRKEGSE